MNFSIVGITLQGAWALYGLLTLTNILSGNEYFDFGGWVLLSLPVVPILATIGLVCFGLDYYKKRRDWTVWTNLALTALFVVFILVVVFFASGAQLA